MEASPGDTPFLPYPFYLYQYQSSDCQLTPDAEQLFWYSQPNQVSTSFYVNHSRQLGQIGSVNIVHIHATKQVSKPEQKIWHIRPETSAVFQVMLGCSTHSRITKYLITRGD